MANIRSQIKRNRQNVKRHDRNQAVRSEVKTRTRHAVEAAEAGADNVEELTNVALRRIDEAATKGVLHKNTAARRKSRLVRQVARLQAD